MPNDLWKYDPDYHRLADLLGLDRDERHNYEVAKKLAVIADAGGLEKSKDIDKTMVATKQLQRRLGVQYQGKPLVDELYKTIRLGLDTQRQVSKPKAKAAAPKIDQDAIVKDVASKVAKQIRKELKPEVEQVPQEASPPPIYGYESQW